MDIESPFNQPIRVALISNTETVHNRDLVLLQQALQAQLDNDFTPVWNIRATVETGVSDDELRRWWQLSIEKNLQTAIEAGRHEVSATGLPVAYVYKEYADTFRIPWQSVASHELLEMLVDPYCQMTVYSPQPDNGYFYCYEICDPCETQTYLVEVPSGQQITVSDFVYPSWFLPLPPPGVNKFDRERKINGPFQLLGGCHIDVLDVCAARWRTFWGDGAGQRYGTLQAIEPRQALRRTPRALWQVSKPRREIRPTRAVEFPALNERVARLEALVAGLEGRAQRRSGPVKPAP